MVRQIPPSVEDVPWLLVARGCAHATSCRVSKELDVELRVGGWLDAMADLGDDDAGVIRIEHELARERRFDDVSQRPGDYVDRSPHAGLRRMIRTKPRGCGRGREVGRALVRDERAGQLEAIAERALELDAEPAGATLFGHDPRPREERRMMPDVLVVAAAQLRDPVAGVVAMKAFDRAQHFSCRVRAAVRADRAR